jgi:2,4-dienoyl-CoA reductase-like NADH-dependent reductase (Old Yellow Enzyme family)
VLFHLHARAATRASYNIKPIQTPYPAGFMSTHPIFSPVTLPSGLILKNRMAKAAMEENMAARGQLPGQELHTLYNTWANGGVGLIISGNVMIDHRAMTGPGGVVLEAHTDLTPFKAWAKAAQANDTRVWMQINHPGRQVYRAMRGNVWAPSAVGLNMGKHSSLFGQPKAMTEADIQETIERFACTAAQAKAAGFDGVQIHAAHGYLLAQFLSPLSNQRSDQWGGTLENRARLLLHVIQALRKSTGPSFPISVKLNSADFQRGGFDIDDARQVVGMLGPLGVDLVELSGGSYEAPAMQGRTADSRSLAREAYFLEFAAEIAKSSPMPIMTTGGIRRLSVAQTVVDQGVSMVGMASALAFTPNLPNQWRQDQQAEGTIRVIDWKDKAISSLATMAVVKRQLRRLGKGKSALPQANPVFTLIMDRIRLKRLTARYLKTHRL